MIAQEILYRRGVFYLSDEDRDAYFPASNHANGGDDDDENDGYDDYDNFALGGVVEAVVAVTATSVATAATAKHSRHRRSRRLTYRELFEAANKRGLRPSIDTTVCCREIADLLKKCWSELIYERPEFTVIRDVVRKSTK